MITVFLVGDGKDTSTGEQICGLLSAYAGVVHITEKRAVQYEKGDGFFVIETERAPILDMDKCVIVFKPSTALRSLPKAYPSGFTAVVGSQNRTAKMLLENRDCRIIVVGTSVRDTLSISSINSDGASISLQRGITTLFGETASECEIKLANNDNASEYALLCTAALLILGSSYEI